MIYLLLILIFYIFVKSLKEGMVPIGPQIERSNVESPPDQPNEIEEIKEVNPKFSFPVKPTCECFDSQTEIFLASNSEAYKELKNNIDILKTKIQKAAESVAFNKKNIEKNEITDMQMCCSTGLKEQCAKNGYSCDKLVVN